jgi:hypothetical protein
LRNFTKTGGRGTDVNFSSIGPFPFNPTFGDTKIVDMYTVGSGWTTAGSYVLLFHALDHLCFSIVFEETDTNTKVASSIIQDTLQLTERATQGDITFDEFIE